MTGDAQGAPDFGAWPKYLPGYRSVAQAAARKSVSNLWGVEIPGNAGLSWPRMFEAVGKGDLKAMYSVGGDPLELGVPERAVESALAKLSFVIVQDCAMTRAAEYPHVVLPGAAFMEKEGTAINCERRIQKLFPVMDPPGEAKPHFDII